VTTTSTPTHTHADSDWHELAHLRGDDGEDLDGDAVELVEATPRARLRQPAEDVAHRLYKGCVCVCGGGEVDVGR
jgi:hypothetical protein